MNKKILAISGSARQHSSNEALLNILSRFFPKNYNLTIFNQLNSLPYFDPDLVNEEHPLPLSVKAFFSMIKEADAVIICTPEYVFSLPGVLKNALEWTVSTTLFSFKPFAFIIASASGDKAFESMDLIMKTLLQQSIPADCKLLIKGVKGKFNESGELKDRNTENSLKLLAGAFSDLIENSH